MTKSRTRALQGAALAIGAPLGWLLIQLGAGSTASAQLGNYPALYLYLLLATVAAFSVFGYLIGDREERLINVVQKLDEVAVTDSLTGLHNARYYHARLDEQVADSRRTGRPLAVGVIDLDHFKKVNDRYGHVAGDLVLASAARAIGMHARRGETVARVGGEEFALLLPGSTAAEAKEAAERIRHAIGSLEVHIPEEDEPVKVTASAGVASTAECPDVTGRDLFIAADNALYSAKDAGRNRTCVAPPDR